MRGVLAYLVAVGLGGVGIFLMLLIRHRYELVCANHSPSCISIDGVLGVLAFYVLIASISIAVFIVTTGKKRN